ncbi:hypothetical protein BOTBODRAFT_34001 [Botryobasidium botryosum FD-172 SS1]|uniref:Aprataxin and PNK-like factor PBZ domain-containing protein n=1 Tax=Botryobasidium botryosum (strain FD-172 SS1) TaxID=930990 RepID=A0A067MAU7_BOTB1|nr:hypothetical protein BOTBODRAFT_34001 [Botryobasidium botryosum FD-172 SS1]
MQLSDLSADIIDSILVSLPDFATLSAAILTSKQLHGVFEERPVSIIRAVAHNIVGPTLPLALELARRQDGCLDGLEKEENPADAPLSYNMANLLVANAKVVRELEDIFSWRNKDRTCKTSKLTAPESDRFHRATYRFWLYAKKSREGEKWDDDGDNDDDDEDDEDDEDKDDGDKDGDDTARHNLQLLSAYSTPELYELKGVAALLTDLLMRNRAANSSYSLHTSFIDPWLLTQGPAAILTAYRGNRVTPLEQWLLEQWHYTAHDFFWDTFGKVCAARGISKEKWTSEDNQILDKVVGENDRCHSCLAIAGMKLWGPPTWEVLYECMTPRDMCNLLEGHLPGNPWETRRIIEALCSGSYDYAEMMGEMMDLETDSGGVWNKQEWYCMNCVEGLFRTRFKEWWLAKKLRDGAPALENCWYGYNCRTQQHKQHHAERLNHLCVPTHGDAPDTT